MALIGSCVHLKYVNFVEKFSSDLYKIKRADEEKETVLKLSSLSRQDNYTDAEKGKYVRIQNKFDDIDTRQKVHLLGLEASGLRSRKKLF